MGEAQDSEFRLEFNGSIRIEARDERLSSDAGALVTREIGERLGLWDFLAERLADDRAPDRVTHSQRALLRTSLCLIAQGWRDQDDADRLRHDPLLRLSTSDRAGSSPLLDAAGGLASQPTLSRLVARLSSPGNRAGLREALLRATVARLRSQSGGKRLAHVTLDVDSLPIEVFGEQAGSAWNGHYHARVYHPLVASLGERGDLVDLRLRPGNVHTADGALEFIPPLLDALERGVADEVSLRIDAGFPGPDLVETLNERGTHYVARFRTNAILAPIAKECEEIARTKAAGEAGEWAVELPPYRAGSWTRDQRLVLVIVREAGELFTRTFFLLTNWTAEEMPAEALLALYRKRGSAESHFGEWKAVLEPALSSTTRPKSHYRGQVPRERTASRDAFACNEVLMLLHGLAYELMHVGRALATQGAAQGMSLRRFRETALKVAARVTLHGRRVVVCIAKSAAALWSALLPRLRSLRPAPA